MSSISLYRFLSFNRNTKEEIYYPMLEAGYSKFIKYIHLTGDLVLINIGFLLAYVIKTGQNPIEGMDNHYLFLHLAFNLIWIITSYSLKIYEIQRVRRIENILWDIIKTSFIHALVIATFIFAIKGYYYSRGHLLISYFLITLFILIWRSVFIRLLKVYRSKGANFRKVIVIGAGSAGNQIYNYFKSNSFDGYKFMGFFDDEPEKSIHKKLILGSVDDVKYYIESQKIDQIYCSLPLTSKRIKELISLADNNLIRFKIVPDFRGFHNKKVNIDFYNHVPVLTLRSEPLQNIINRIVKRSFDILFSLLVILLLFPPLLIVISLLIKLTSKGPVFFRQKRNGRNNKEFYCYKFRTMTVNEKSDTLQATAGDSRITRIGAFLRRTNLDELPQFYNVLIGNMSVVGPRPHMLKHTDEYSKIIDKFMVRHLIKPGITGWAQIHGYRGVTDEPKKMIKRVKYDRWYVENWTFLLDLLIIIRTITNMIKGEKNAL